jgi:hypothetical protein
LRSESDATANLFDPDRVQNEMQQHQIKKILTNYLPINFAKFAVCKIPQIIDTKFLQNKYKFRD